MGVVDIKVKLRSSKSSEHIKEKKDRAYGRLVKPLQLPFRFGKMELKRNTVI